MESTLTPRLPHIDFSEADPRWLPQAPGLAHELNAASLGLPYLEPYLIKVMRAARPEVQKRAPELLADLDAFNRQEANHYRVHADYNRILRAQYPGLESFEEAIARDFERFFAERSLEWNLAYSEGFESMGMIAAEFVLEDAEAFFSHGDPRVAELWRWHLAEEFEHRSVAHDVLRTLAPGWARRLRGFFFCLRHLVGFTMRVRRFMLEADIERGRLPAAARNLPSNTAIDRRRARFMLPRVAKILMPRYDPRPRAMGSATQRVLRRYEA